MLVSRQEGEQLISQIASFGFIEVNRGMFWYRQMTPSAEFSCTWSVQAVSEDVLNATYFFTRKEGMCRCNVVEESEIPVSLQGMNHRILSTISRFVGRGL